jgi:hypothetical protein
VCTIHGTLVRLVVTRFTTSFLASLKTRRIPLAETLYIRHSKAYDLKTQEGLKFSKYLSLFVSTIHFSRQDGHSHGHRIHILQRYLHYAANPFRDSFPRGSLGRKILRQSRRAPLYCSLWPRRNHRGTDPLYYFNRPENGVSIISRLSK